MKKIIGIIINLSVVIAGGGMMVYCFFSWQGTVLALTNNYSKSETSSPPDSQITSGEWNHLLDDFVNQTGDVMAGNLDMGGHRVTSLPDPENAYDLANRRWVENQTESAFTSFISGALDRNGNPLSIVCGRSGSNFVTYSSTHLMIDIDTTGPVPGMTDPIFSGTPQYFISLGGDDRHFEPEGQSSIYAIDSPVPIPMSSGFRVYLHEADVSPNITAAEANNLHWHINWCGIGTIF